MQYRLRTLLIVLFVIVVLIAIRLLKHHGRIAPAVKSRKQESEAASEMETMRDTPRFVKEEAERIRKNEKQTDPSYPQREALLKGLSAINSALAIVEGITQEYPQFPYDTSRLKDLKAGYTRGLEQLDAGILDERAMSGTREEVLAVRKWAESVRARISSENLGVEKG